MAIILADGKAYYNAYNFAIGTDSAKPAFVALTSTAIVNTITTTGSTFNILLKHLEKRD